MNPTHHRAPAFVHRVGIDLVEVQRIEKLLSAQPGIKQNIFCEEEIRYSQRQFSPCQHLASRFAAKEALFKALGTGLSGDMSWQDVEVQREPSGKPTLRLSGKTAEFARQMGAVRCEVSMSHVKEYAVALVVLAVRER